MAITVHQTKWAGRAANVPSLAVTFDTNPTAARAVIVAVWNYNGAVANTITSVTDNQGGSNTYSQAERAFISISADIVEVVIYHCLNIVASGAFTVTVNISGGNSSIPNIAVLEVSGLVTSGKDQSGTATDTVPVSDATVSTSAPTTVASELVVACFGDYNATNAAVTVTGGYANIGEEEDGTVWLPGSADYEIVSTTGTKSASWTHANAQWAAVIATYASATVAEIPKIRTVQSTMRW